MTVPLGRAVDGLLAVIVETTDTVTGQIVSEEQLVLAQEVAAAPAVKPLRGMLQSKKGGLSAAKAAWSLQRG